MNWYTYHFISDGRILHGGITTDPKRREAEHRQKWPSGFLQIAGGPMTESKARA